MFSVGLLLCFQTLGVRIFMTKQNPVPQHLLPSCLMNSHVSPRVRATECIRTHVFMYQPPKIPAELKYHHFHQSPRSPAHKELLKGIPRAPQKPACQTVAPLNPADSRDLHILGSRNTRDPGWLAMHHVLLRVVYFYFNICEGDKVRRLHAGIYVLDPRERSFACFVPSASHCEVETPR